MQLERAAHLLGPLAHVHGQRREIDVRQPEHQRRGLHAPARVALLCRHAGARGNVRVRGRVDRALRAVLADSADGRDARAGHATVFHERVEKPGVQQ